MDTFYYVYVSFVFGLLEAWIVNECACKALWVTFCCFKMSYMN